MSRIRIAALSLHFASNYCISVQNKVADKVDFPTTSTGRQHGEGRAG